MKRVKIVAGVSVHLISSDEMSFSYVILKEKKGLITVEDKKEIITSLDELKKSIPGRVPVLLNIDGWGVLVKKDISKSDDRSDSIYDNKEFEIRKYFSGSGDKGFMSIARLDVINDLIEKIGSIGSGMLGIDVGPYEGIQLLIALRQEGEFIIGKRKVIINNGVVEDIKNAFVNEQSFISAGDEVISSYLFPGYAMAAIFFAGGFQGLERSKKSLNEFLYKKLTSYTVISSLGILFFGLLVNYFVFSVYQDKLEVLSSRFETDQSLYHKLEEADKELKQKEGLIENSGINGHTTFAYFADRLAFLMPQQIVLEEMDFQPLEKKLQRGQEAVFGEKKISISGRTPDPLLINDWIKSLKNEKWVKYVDMTYYGQEEKGKNALFKLEIKF